MNQLPIVQAMIVCSIVFATQPCQGQSNWPEFRGPTADGHAEQSELPTQIGEKDNVAWKTPIHGKGWSSPVIWENQVWLTTATADGKKMSVVCADLQSGALVHDFTLYENGEPDFCHPTNSYASPTPAIEAGRVYVHFGKYGTCCIDTATGKPIWNRTNLECDHFRGAGSSPILFRRAASKKLPETDVGLFKQFAQTFIWKSVFLEQFSWMIQRRYQIRC